MAVARDRAHDPLVAAMAAASGRAHDPLVAAMERSRDPHAALTGARATTTTTAVSDAADFDGPTWVRRLDPRIRVAQTIKAEQERAEHDAKAAAEGAMTNEGAARRSA
jgi:hypothetical protein